MKRLILFFALLLTASSSFISCRDTKDKPVKDAIDDVGDDIDDAADDISDQF